MNGISEMSVDALLSGIETADEGIKGFWIIFGDIKLETVGIESKDLGKGSVDYLEDEFGKISHAPEHQFDVGKKVLFKLGEKRSIGVLKELEKGGISSIKIS